MKNGAALATWRASRALRRLQQGFTLLEVVVGLLVATMIVTGLTAAARTVSLGWQNGSAVAMRHDMFDRALDVIAGDIARIERVTEPGAHPRRYMFYGASTELIYVLVERPYPTRPQPYFVRLAMEEYPGSTKLVRSRAPYDPNERNLSRLSWRDEATLIDGKYRFQFSYRGEPGGLEEWADTWAHSNRLPREVRFEVSDRRSGRLAIPRVITGLRIGAEFDCARSQTTICTTKTGGILMGNVQ